jgi:hypothetical protein
MDRAADAYRLLLERQNFGKVVLQIAILTGQQS